MRKQVYGDETFTNEIIKQNNISTSYLETFALISKHTCSCMRFLGNGELFNDIVLSMEMKSYFAITFASWIQSILIEIPSKTLEQIELKIGFQLASIGSIRERTHATMLKQKRVYFTQAILRARRAALSPRESAFLISLPFFIELCKYLHNFF